MSNFERAENKGRNLFRTILKQYNLTNYGEMRDKFDTLDMWYNILDIMVGVEIKVRDIKYQDYNTLVMDYSKYYNLKERYQNKEFDQIQYVNFIGENICYIFRLTDIIKGIKDGKVDLKQNLSNRRTAVESDKIWKWQLFIPKHLGTKYIRINNKWTKQTSL